MGIKLCDRICNGIKLWSSWDPWDRRFFRDAMPPRNHPISGARYIRHTRFEGPRRVGAFWMTHGGCAMAVALWHACFLKHEQQPGYTWTYIIIHLILKTVLTPFEKNINHQYPSTQRSRHNRGLCMSNPSRMPRWLTHSEIDPTRFWDHYPLKRHIATYSPYSF